MRYYVCLQGGVRGPLLPEEISSLFGGIAPDVMACPELGYETGSPQWRRAALLPELAPCVKAEISEPLPLGSPSSPPPRALSILSTDDDQNIRALLWGLLSDAGHSVEFARDGEEVFRRLRDKRYDLLILDVNMPKMNGYKVSELIHEKLPDPPKVIIFTGRDLEKEKLQFVVSGADAILNKGTGNEKLLETIGRLFAPPQVKEAPAPPAFLPEPEPPGVSLSEKDFAGAPEPPPAPLPAPLRPAASAPPVPAPPPPSFPAPSDYARLSSELAELRAEVRSHERACSRSDGCLAARALELAEANLQAVRRVELEWRALRLRLGLAVLGLALAVLAALFSR